MITHVDGGFQAMTLSCDLVAPWLLTQVAWDIVCIFYGTILHFDTAFVPLVRRLYTICGISHNTVV
jgi:hypothetical protein